MASPRGAARLPRGAGAPPPPPVVVPAPEPEEEEDYDGMDDGDVGEYEDDGGAAAAAPASSSSSSSEPNRSKWTPNEDDALRKAVGKWGARNWKTIAAYVPGRTDVQCLHRWQKVLRPGE
jgi:hypothetical protein